MEWHEGTSNVSEYSTYWADDGDKKRVHVSYMFYATPGPSRGEVIPASGWYWYTASASGAVFSRAHGPYATAEEAQSRYDRRISRR